MSTRRTLPTREYRLNDPRMKKDIPAFALAKVKDIVDGRRLVEEELPEEEAFCYAEVQVCLEEVTNSMKIEIADLGYAIHFVYPGGAVTWMRLDNPISFEAIPDHLLPAMSERDPFIWWIVSNTDYEYWPRVVKARIVTQDQITEAFRLW
jgi:hypothetical protein